MRNLKLPLLAILAAAAVVAVSSRGEARSDDLIAGERVPIEKPPYWSNSAAWDKDGNLLLVDVLRSEVRRYDPAGRYLGTLDDTYAKSQGFSNPTLIQNGEAGSVWIEYEDGHLVKLNRELKGESHLTLTGARGEQGKLIAIFWWMPLGNSELLAFADIQRGNNTTGAVLKIPIAAPGNFEVLQKIAADSPAHRFFLVGQSFLASVQGEPYYLIMGPTPYVVRPDGSGFRFVHVTKDGRVPIGRPELPARVTMESTSLLFQRLEEAAAPVGLYGWGEYLYALMRTPSGGRTAWNLLKISPGTGKVLWNRELDTAANHLVVVPGETQWAFVEKGPVKGPGRQAIRFFMLVPTSVLEE